MSPSTRSDWWRRAFRSPNSLVGCPVASRLRTAKLRSIWSTGPSENASSTGRKTTTRRPGSPEGPSSPTIDGETQTQFFGPPGRVGECPQEFRRPEALIDDSGAGIVHRDRMKKIDRYPSQTRFFHESELAVDLAFRPGRAEDAPVHPHPGLGRNIPKSRGKIIGARSRRIESQGQAGDGEDG